MNEEWEWQTSRRRVGASVALNTYIIWYMWYVILISPRISHFNWVSVISQAKMKLPSLLVLTRYLSDVSLTRQFVIVTSGPMSRVYVSPTPPMQPGHWLKMGWCLGKAGHTATIIPLKTGDAHTEFLSPWLPAHCIRPTHTEPGTPELLSKLGQTRWGHFCVCHSLCCHVILQTPVLAEEVTG